jgi:hypothetical protein
VANCRRAGTRNENLDSAQPVVMRTLGAAGGDKTLKSSFCRLEGAASRATTMLSAMQLTTARSELRMMLFMGAIVNGAVGIL